MIILSSIIIIPISQGATTNNYYSGFSGYVDSTSDLDDIISNMTYYNMTVFRISFNPSWYSTQAHPYNYTLIDYYLAHTYDNMSIIADVNHLYRKDNDHIIASSDALDHWSAVNQSIYNVLSRYKNNMRVMVELINEYALSDFYSRIQSIVTDVRNHGYLNCLVFNKWGNASSWNNVTDNLSYVYQGYHYYFNYGTNESAWNIASQTVSQDIWVINTEVGASSNEYRYFDNTNVAMLSSFLNNSYNLRSNYGNLIWMNHNTENLATYKSLGLWFPPSILSNTPASTRSFYDYVMLTLQSSEPSSFLWWILIIPIAIACAFVLTAAMHDRIRRKRRKEP